MDPDSSPYRGVVPEYLRERFDPGVKSVSELMSILCENGVSVGKRITKGELVYLYEVNIRKNRKHFIHRILKSSQKGSVCKSPLGYKPSNEFTTNTSAEYSNTSGLPKYANRFLHPKEKVGDADPLAQNKFYIKSEKSLDSGKAYRLSSISDEERRECKPKLRKHKIEVKDGDLDGFAARVDLDTGYEANILPTDRRLYTLAIDERLHSEGPHDNPPRGSGGLYSQDSLEEQMSLLREASDKVPEANTPLTEQREPVFDDELSSNASTEYSDESPKLHNDKATIVSTVKNSIRTRLGKIFPRDSISQVSNISRCSRCKLGKYTHRPLLLARLLLTLALPLIITISIWIDDFYKDYKYCPAGVTPSVDRTYSGPNIFRRKLSSCRACPEHAVCSSRQVLLCSKKGYYLTPPFITHIISSNYLPFFMAEGYCKEDYNEIRGRMLGDKRVNSLAIIAEKISRKWVGEAECNLADAELVKSVKNSNNNHLSGIPFALALEKTKEIVQNYKWADTQFEKSWKELVRRLVEPPSENEIRDKVFDRLSLQMSTDGNYRFIVSSRSPILPTRCKIRKAIWSLMYENFMVVSSVICLGSCVWFLYDHYFTMWSHAQIVAAITETIINSISSNRVYSQCSVAELEQILLPKIMPGSELRRFNRRCIDDPRTGLPQWIIRNQDERELIWSRVSAQVRNNPCIREILVDSEGERRTQWKWTGTTLKNTLFVQD